MRALFTTQPGFGHLNPLLPYAVAMRDAGHEVRFASAAVFAEAIEQHEFECAAIGPDFTWEAPERYFPAIADAARAGRALQYANFEITWKHWNPRAAQDLLALCEDWRPDVIIREFAENGATFAGEIAAIPVVCASWSALPNDGRRWGSVLDWDRTLECYEALRRELGVAPERPGAAWERQLVVTGLPNTWFRDAASAPVVRHFRLPLTEGPPRSPPPWLPALGRDRPLVYATLGTVFNRLRKLRAALLEALADLDVDVLMTVGRNVDPDTIGSIAPNTRVEQFIPQSQILPRASLLVSHAGLGTMLGGIYHGVPMLLIAIDADQPINARCAAEAGIALALELSQVNATTVRAAAESALNSPSLRQSARTLREECDAMDTIDAAVTTIEQQAAQARPSNDHGR
jgi:UDP:flavonoid glycosyltransferase YjiC (YdhE family)